jgi:hypothetical protein
MGQDHPPVDFLVSSSNTSLEEFELARLNKAANLRKEMREIVDEWVDAEVDSRVARWILECRRAETAGGFDAIAPRMEPVRGTQLALNLRARPHLGIRPTSEDQTDHCQSAASPQSAPSPQATQPALGQGASLLAATACSADREKGVPCETSREMLREMLREKLQPPLPSGEILECNEVSGLLALFDMDTKQSSEEARCTEEQDLKKADRGKLSPMRKRYRNRNSLKLPRSADPRQPAEPRMKWRPVAAHSALQPSTSMEPALA